MRFFFDPDSLFIRVTGGVVLQVVLVGSAVALGYTLGLGHYRMSGVIGGFMVVSVVLGRTSLLQVIDAARREGHRRTIVAFTAWLEHAWQVERQAEIEVEPPRVEPVETDTLADAPVRTAPPPREATQSGSFRRL